MLSLIVLLKANQIIQITIKVFAHKLVRFKSVIPLLNLFVKRSGGIFDFLIVPGQLVHRVVDRVTDAGVVDFIVQCFHTVGRQHTVNCRKTFFPTLPGQRHVYSTLHTRGDIRELIVRQRVIRIERTLH